MKKVVCINDKKLPPGTEIVEGVEYEVEDIFINPFDQVVYIIAGINNQGETKLGMMWIGYLSTRFRELEKAEAVEEYAYALN